MTTYKRPRSKYAIMILSLLGALGYAGLLAAPTVSALHIEPAYRYSVIPDVTNGSSTFPASLTVYGAVNYSAGNFIGTANFAGIAGNDTITSSTATVYVTKHGNDGSYDWTRTFDTDTGGNGGSASATDIATDPSGTVYVAGSFSGHVIFDGPGGSDSQSISGSGSFLTKYSPTGTYLGTKTIIPPPNGSASASSLAIDGSGNVYLAGSFNGTVNFAATNGGNDPMTDAGGSGNVFVTRFNANGSYGWTKTFDTSPGGGAYSPQVAVDAGGNVYLTGDFYNTINFAGTSGSDSYTDPNSNIFITKFNANGSYGWTKTVTNSSSSYESANSIATDPAGNVYVTGNFSGSLNFAGAAGNDTQTDVGGSGNAYLLKYNKNGSYGWTKTFDTTAGGSANGQAVTTDINGDIYMLSGFNGSVNFAGSNGSDSQNQSNDGAVTMYEPDGSYAWTRVFDTTNGSAVVAQGLYPGLMTDTVGNLYINSIFTGSVGFDGPGGSDVQTTNGYGSAFLTSYKTFIPNSPATASAVTTSTSPNVNSNAAVPNTGFGMGSQSGGVVALVSATGGATLLMLGLRLGRQRSIEV